MGQRVDLTYQKIEEIIISFIPKLKKQKIDQVVGILRGGTVPAFMAAHALDAPLNFVRYNRESRKVAWFGESPPPQSHLLLVDDIAGSGFTFADAVTFLQNQRYVLSTMTLVRDEKSRLIPDFALNIENKTAVFPWERHRYQTDFLKDLSNPSPLFRKDSEYMTIGFDLDGLLLPDIPDQNYKENLEKTLSDRDELLPHLLSEVPAHTKDTLVIITGRPYSDFDRTRRWLDSHGFREVPLFCRPDDLYPYSETPRFKADQCKKLGVTHYYESDLFQANLISHYAPLLYVYYWNPERKIKMRVGAQVII